MTHAARQAAIAGGLGMAIPALTINKVCLSGIDAIALADQMIRAGEFDAVVAGGMESMSQATERSLAVDGGMPARWLLTYAPCSQCSSRTPPEPRTAGNHVTYIVRARPSSPLNQAASRVTPPAATAICTARPLGPSGCTQIVGGTPRNQSETHRPLDMILS